MSKASPLTPLSRIPSAHPLSFNFLTSPHSPNPLSQLPANTFFNFYPQGPSRFRPLLLFHIFSLLYILAFQMQLSRLHFCVHTPIIIMTVITNVASLGRSAEEVTIFNPQALMIIPQMQMVWAVACARICAHVAGTFVHTYVM